MHEQAYKDQLLGHRLREVRAARGMTQLQLAYAAGVGLGTIGRLERAQTRSYLGTVGAVCDALSIDLNLLMAEVT